MAAQRICPARDFWTLSLDDLNILLLADAERQEDKIAKRKQDFTSLYNLVGGLLHAYLSDGRGPFKPVTSEELFQPTAPLEEVATRYERALEREQAYINHG